MGSISMLGMPDSDHLFCDLGVRPCFCKRLLVALRPASRRSISSLIIIAEDLAEMSHGQGTILYSISMLVVPDSDHLFCDLGVRPCFCKRLLVAIRPASRRSISSLIIVAEDIAEMSHGQGTILYSISMLV